MPTVEKTHGGQVYLTAIGTRVSTGDRIDVSEGFAEHLTETRGDFKIVDGTAEPDADDTEDDDGGNEFDVEAFVTRTPVEDVADDIRAGEADEHLEAVDEEATRVTVQDAIGERRAELEG